MQHAMLMWRINGEVRLMAQNDLLNVNVIAPTEVVSFINTTERSDSQILRQIESLSISADAKALLADLLKLATRVGQTVLRIGRKIIDFVLSLLRAFPHIGFRVVVAVVATMLISMVPVIGTALASVLGPLALALGIVWGGAIEVRSPDFEKRVRDFATEF
jgi:hypothetical protein